VQLSQTTSLFAKNSTVATNEFSMFRFSITALIELYFLAAYKAFLANSRATVYKEKINNNQ
jgi:hypothetical protein